MAKHFGRWAGKSAEEHAKDKAAAPKRRSRRLREFQESEGPVTLEELHRAYDEIDRLRREAGDER